MGIVIRIFSFFIFLKKPYRLLSHHTGASLHPEERLRQIRLKMENLGITIMMKKGYNRVMLNGQRKCLAHPYPVK